MNPHRVMLQAGGSVADWYIRCDVASTERCERVEEERERIAVLLDAMVKDAEEAAEHDSQQPYDRNGVDAGYAHRLEELAKSLRGES